MIHALSYGIYYCLGDEMLVQFVASFLLLAFATTDFPGFLFDSSSQLKITILYVWTAASTLIPLLILQRRSDTDTCQHAKHIYWLILLATTKRGLSLPQHVISAGWIHTACEEEVQVKASLYPILAFPCFASHLVHCQRRAETETQSTN